MTLIVAVDNAKSIVALRELVELLCGEVEGFKIGLPLLLRYGVDAARVVRSTCSSGLVVADLKLADIGAVMRMVAGLVVDHVDAVIAHSFVGYTGALDELRAMLEEKGRRLVLVASMSHPGSSEVYDKALPYILAVIKRVEPWGLVAPATRPEIIAVLRRRLGGRYRILSPGVGVQGAEPGEALCAGADYEIVGRAITSSPEPRAAARLVKRRQMEAVEKCAVTGTG